MCMKKYLFLLFGVLLFAGSNINAQRYAIIDTKYILSKIPDYVDADKKLQLLSDQWQKF
jgi:outer membrane protein